MKRSLHWLAVALGASAGVCAAAPPTIGGCQVFPTNNIWNTRIDNLPVHANSSNWVGTIGTLTKLHADFGNVLADNYGIPFVTVTGAQPTVPINYDPNGAADESDPGPYPVPPGAPIEGGPVAPAGDDRHVIVVETTNCTLYELYQAFPIGGGASWTVYSSARWNLKSNALRPIGWTSADAANLPIFAGLTRYDEVASGEITHPLRLTAVNIYGQDTSVPPVHQWIWPASHWSGVKNNPAFPPMGARFRLKSSYAIPASFAPETKVILTALKKYGFILADGGSNWFFSGTSDTRWPDQLFSDFASASAPKGSDFEAVDAAPIMIDVASGQALQLGASGRMDSNGDSKGDVLFRRSDGTNYVWQVDGASISGGVVSIASQGLLPGVDTSWFVAGIGDFNGDGKSDILWRNASGANYVWHLNGASISGGVLTIVSQGLLPSVDTSWSVVGIGDFNGDGKSDILWRRTDGTNYVWHVNGAVIAGGVLQISSQGLLPGVPTDWSVAGVGDFNGDGKSDIFWRRTDGTNYVWHVDGSVITGGVLSIASQGLLPGVDASWSVVGTGDYNADGKSDIFFRRADGTNYVWHVNGAVITGGVLQIASQGLLPNVDASWTVAGQSDYNGDGRSDVLWRRNDGTNYVWHVDGKLISGGVLSIVSQGLLPSVDTTWSVINPR